VESLFPFCLAALALAAVSTTAALATPADEIRLTVTKNPLIPDDVHYDHEATWNDDNGHSHLRASLLGPGLTIPFADGRLLTGEYQQVTLVDFDTRPRRRKIICTVIA